ncbi:MAG: hypothetical protein QOJ59_2490 [Thermomicrobiales bacterium]|nr:hypothetical protein [Thermomicrobiales bacterium]
MDSNVSRSDRASSPSYLFISASVVNGRHDPRAPRARRTLPRATARATGCRRCGGAAYTHPAQSVTRDTLQKLVAEILAAWRRAERLASTLPAESPEHEAAQRACNRLRDAYQELTHSGVAEALTAAEAKMLLRDAASDLDP